MKSKPRRRYWAKCAVTLVAAALLALFLLAVPAMATTPDLPGDAGEDSIFPFNLITELLRGTDVEDASNTIELILLLTVLTLVPSILIMMTSFTRIVIILSFTRNAMGTQTMPPNQVIIGLALFLTYFTMYGTIQDINNNAWRPYNAGEIDIAEAAPLAVQPLRDFMLHQIEMQDHLTDLQQMMNLAGLPEFVDNYDEIPTHVLIPAFITSEIKTAFRIGLIIFVPFIVIDMIVASALMSMGMMMLPPVMISLPFKIMLFVLVDGWNLVITTIIRTFVG
jgi:flagellar biosynthetic protein FliP